MQHLADSIRQHAELVYLTTMLWTFFEGETFVLLGGLLASQGAVDPWLFGASAWVGSFVGDQAWFLAGRCFGNGVVARRPHWRAGLNRAFGWIDHWGTAFILSFRFVYGVRNLASLALGMSPIGWSRFASLNFAPAALWAAAFVTGGYLAGRLCGAAGADLLAARGPWTLLGFVVLVGGGYGLRRWHLRQY